MTPLLPSIRGGVDVLWCLALFLCFLLMPRSPCRETAALFDEGILMSEWVKAKWWTNPPYISVQLICMPIHSLVDACMDGAHEIFEEMFASHSLILQMSYWYIWMVYHASMMTATKRAMIARILRKAALIIRNRRTKVWGVTLSDKVFCACCTHSLRMITFSSWYEQKIYHCMY